MAVLPLGLADGYRCAVLQSRALARGLFALCLLGGLLLLLGTLLPSGRVGTQHDPRLLTEQRRASAQRIATVVGSALEHTMTAGDPLDTRALIERIESRLPATEIDLYDHRGMQVYGAMPKAPHPRDMKPGVVATLTDHQRRVGRLGWIYRPVLAEPLCASCHTDRAEIRGVLAIELATGACSGAGTGADDAYLALADATATQLVASGNAELSSAWSALIAPGSSPRACPDDLELLLDRALRYSMLARQGRRVTELLDLAASSELVEQVALYDNSGRLYWKTQHQAPPALIAEALSTQRIVAGSLGEAADAPGSGQASGRDQVVLPIIHRDSCTRCHGATDQPRGAIAVTITAPEHAVADSARAPLLAPASTRILHIGLGALLLCGALLLLLGMRRR